jgi:hypothetical protein
VALIAKSYILPLFLLLAALPAGAQRKVSADVEVKTVNNGKLTTVTKSVYCTNNGRLVTLFRNPYTYYVVSNAKGEVQIYRPDTNEILPQTDKSLSSNTELVSLFMQGRIDDLGLGFFGYKVTATTRDDGYIKKTFTANDVQLPVVDIVYEDYLPIYCEYTAPDGKLLSKKYLSDYQRFGRFILPCRTTDILYGEKRDSSVTRILYKNVKVDVDDPNFNFEVPANAKTMPTPEAAK